MSGEVMRYAPNRMDFDRSFIEAIILKLGDLYEIRIVWDQDTAILTGALALAGGVMGGYAGGRMGAALGAGIGGVTGFGLAKIISLRELWSKVKEYLQELVYIVLNHLRRVDPVDYITAAELVLACLDSRRELVMKILDFIAQKLGREVLSNLVMMEHNPGNLLEQSSTQNQCRQFIR